MSATSPGNSRICPNCGHPNSSFSLFCAECGESLSAAGNSDDTGQTTALFTPVTTDQESPGAHSTASDDRYATAEFRPQPAATPVDDQATTSGWYAPAGWSAYEGAPMPESRRGFWLGIFATILILVVLGFFGWSTLASEGFRDTFTGIFLIR